jgi:hypothetical protein
VCTDLIATHPLELALRERTERHRRSRNYCDQFGQVGCLPSCVGIHSHTHRHIRTFTFTNILNQTPNNNNTKHTDGGGEDKQVTEEEVLN